MPSVDDRPRSLRLGCRRRRRQSIAMIVIGGRFVERNADGVIARVRADCSSAASRARQELVRCSRCPRSTRIVSKNSSWTMSKPSCSSQSARRRASRCTRCGDCSQSARTVINRIHRRDDGEEHLRRADVTRRFVAADVLLARLQREPVSRASVGIVRNADEPARHVAFVCIARREIGGVRSAESERNAETLRAADRDIGAEFARRLQQSQRENIGRDDDERAGVVRALRRTFVIDRSRRRSPDIARERRRPCRRI